MAWLIHFGIPRRSGRYKWGSGQNPYHHGTASPYGWSPPSKSTPSAKSVLKDLLSGIIVDDSDIKRSSNNLDSLIAGNDSLNYNLTRKKLDTTHRSENPVPRGRDLEDQLAREHYNEVKQRLFEETGYYDPSEHYWGSKYQERVDNSNKYRSSIAADYAGESVYRDRNRINRLRPKYSDEIALDPRKRLKRY